MATCITFNSIQETEDYLNSITLPSSWVVVGNGGKPSFVSPDDVIAGGVNGVTLVLAQSEVDLEDKLNALSGLGTVVDVFTLGAYYVIVQSAVSVVAAYDVNTYESTVDLANATGLTVTGVLDDSTAISTTSDRLISFGGTYTLIESIPATLIIVGKGGYYTTIQKL